MRNYGFNAKPFKMMCLSMLWQNKIEKKKKLWLNYSSKLQ